MFEKKLSPPIHWHEGMFLQPHHFQQFERRMEDLLAYKAFMASPFQWGVRGLEIDEKALAGGRFTVTEIEAILPDGLVIQNEYLARPLDRDIGQYADRLQDGEVLKVWLAVPNPMEKCVEVHEGEDVGHPLRYQVQPPVDIKDQTTGMNESPVTFLRIKAQLLVGDEDLTGYQALPLAEMVYDGGLFKISDFIPPTVIVVPESPISELVRKLCQSIRSKAAEAAGGFDAAVRHQKRDPRLENRLRAFGLVGSLLPLEQMVETGCFRPIDVYMALCRILGELSTLRHELEIPGTAPPYNHGDLRKTFGELSRRIDLLLVEGVDNYEKLEVRGSDGKFEVVNLAAAHLDRAIFIAVRGKARSDPEALGRWLEQNCIIANGDQIRDFIKYKILGIERKLMSPHPIDLQLERGTLLYQLILSDESRQSLEKNQKLFFVRAGDDPPGHERPRLLDVYVRKGR